MRHCTVQVDSGGLCNRIVHNRAPALPICEVHLKMIYDYEEAVLRGVVPATCDFYHWAHAGLVRSREARN